MKAHPLLLRFLGAVVVLQRLAAAVAAPVQFQWWYPQFRPVFDKILHENCSSQYAAYFNGDVAPADVAAASMSAINGDDASTEPVVNCILQNTSNFIQTNMQSAGVLLGIMPSVLSVLGSSTEETALLFVIGRRPLLTMLLAAGSPVVVALRPFEYREPVGMLRERERRFHSLGNKFCERMHTVVLVAEYLLVMVAVANVAHVSYQLGIGVIIIYSPHSTFLPALWAVSGVLVHIIGAVCLRSRLAVTAQKSKVSWARKLLNSEFTLSSRKNLLVTTKPENKRFLILSWFTSMTSTFHVIFGTLTFASMLFISVRDSFGVTGRYIASVAICRIVLMYELDGLRSTVNVDVQETTNNILDEKLPTVKTSGGSQEAQNT